jgi:hypothetical protein
MATVWIEPGTLANALPICAVQDFSFLHSVQTHPPIQWVRQQEREADFHLVPRSRMVELYLHSSICLHG